METRQKFHMIRGDEIDLTQAFVDLSARNKVQKINLPGRLAHFANN